MNPMNDRTQLGQPPTAAQPAPRKRFRIEKLEDRIAPTKDQHEVLRQLQPLHP
jgi:hypothetical protein